MLWININITNKILQLLTNFFTDYCKCYGLPSILRIIFFYDFTVISQSPSSITNTFPYRISCIKRITVFLKHNIKIKYQFIPNKEYRGKCSLYLNIHLQKSKTILRLSVSLSPSFFYVTCLVIQIQDNCIAPCAERSVSVGFISPLICSIGRFRHP